MRFREFIYRTYRRGSGSMDNWGLWRLTRAGQLLSIMAMITAALGLDTRATVVYKGFALLLALFVVAYLWSRSLRGLPLTIVRVLPRFGTVGETLQYTLRIRNESARAQRDLLLYDTVANVGPTLEEFLYTPEPGEERRNIYDRTLLVYRWNWLWTMKRGVYMQEQPLPPLPPQTTYDCRVTITPLRRGYLHLASVAVHRPDPLNLLKAFVRLPLPDNLLILPKRYPLPAIHLPGIRKFNSGGVALVSSVGDSEEFLTLREYRPGDPLRHIHWRSWAKTGKPVVKEFQAEYFVRHALVLDTFQLPEYTAIFEEAVSLAASFACTVRTQESLLDLLFVGPEAYCFTAGRGLGDTEQMLSILAAVKPCRDKSFNALAPRVLERTNLLSGCICILLTWDAERQVFLTALQALNIPRLVLILTEAGQTLPADVLNLPGVHQLEVGKIQEDLQQL